MLLERLPKEETEREEPRDYLRGTDLGRCRRFVSASCHGLPGVRPASLRAFFAAGTALEQAFAKELKKCFSRVEMQLPVERKIADTLIKGRADFVVEVDGEPVVIEFKAVSPRKFFRAALLRRLPPQFLYQTAFYRAFLETERQLPGVLILENMESGERVEFQIEAGQSEVRTEVAFLRPALSTPPEALPLRPKDAPRLDCRYCSFQHLCRELRMKGVEITAELCNLAEDFLSLKHMAEAYQAEAERIKAILLEQLPPEQLVSTPAGTVIKVLRKRREVSQAIVPKLIELGLYDLLRPAPPSVLEQAAREGRLPKEILEAALEERRVASLIEK